MLFSSFEFIFLFLPIVVFSYFFTCNKCRRLSGVVLVAASLFFYGYYKFSNIFIILASIIINYTLGSMLTQSSPASPAREKGKRKAVLTIGILFNILLLTYYKYTHFIVDNVNAVFNTSHSIEPIILPLAISFFTFQQIAYLNDSYNYETKQHSFSSYALFVSFFPQLIAGPIVHHKEMLPQLIDKTNKAISWENIHHGICLFIIGLFKKIVIADTFAQWVGPGHSATTGIQFFEAWNTSLCYSIQLYFDFSGYADMAIGIALLFNIHLPINFDSPYKAKDIQEFWRRWHITLSRFLRKYLYFPLGGNRVRELLIYRNLLIVFVIGGIWHGAGWTFLIWGCLHGAAICIHRLWTKMNLTLPPTFAWVTTFMFVNVAWVFFRADTVTDAVNILEGMCGLNGFSVSRTFRWAQDLGANVTDSSFTVSVWTVLLVLIILQDVFYKNSQEWMKAIKPRWNWTTAMAIMLTTSIIVSLQHQRVSEFIYWQF